MSVGNVQEWSVKNRLDYHLRNYDNLKLLKVHLIITCPTNTLCHTWQNVDFKSRLHEHIWPYLHHFKAQCMLFASGVCALKWCDCDKIYSSVDAALC